MNRELSLLGLAKKAGRLAVGQEAVEAALRQNRAKLVVLAQDAASNTMRRFQNRSGEVLLATLPYTKEELGAAIGYRSCAVAAVCDDSFAQALCRTDILSGSTPPESFDTVKRPKETNN